MFAARRLLKELSDAESSLRKPDAQHSLVRALGPLDDSDLFVWRAVIAGSPGSPYADGVFELAIDVSHEYPMQPPAIRFLTPVCHPNIHIKTGEICLDLLKTAWSPAWTLYSACVAVAVLLTAPEANSPLNCDAANLLRAGDIRGYNSLARMYTLIYACSSSAILP